VSLTFSRRRAAADERVTGGASVVRANLESNIGSQKNSSGGGIQQQFLKNLSPEKYGTLVETRHSPVPL
jgi:hypothetical protein